MSRNVEHLDPEQARGKAGNQALLGGYLSQAAGLGKNGLERPSCWKPYRAQAKKGPSNPDSLVSKNGEKPFWLFGFWLPQFI